MKTVAIISGWAEGAWQSRLLVQALESRGFKPTNQPKLADVIVAHSLGCYLVPKQARAELVLLVGLPYWPQKSVLKSLAEKLTMENRDRRQNQGSAWLLTKTAHNIFYIFRHPSKTLYAFNMQKAANLPTAARVILIRNNEDSFLKPEFAARLSKKRGWQLVKLPGLHDDIWLNPVPYIDLISKAI